MPPVRILGGSLDNFLLTSGPAIFHYLFSNHNNGLILAFIQDSTLLGFMPNGSKIPIKILDPRPRKSEFIAFFSSVILTFLGLSPILQIGFASWLLQGYNQPKHSTGPKETLATTSQATTYFT